MTPSRRWRALAPYALLGALAGLGAVVFVVAALIAGTQTIPVTVIVAGDARPTRSRAATVGDLLAELGIVLGEGDTLTPSRETLLTPDLVVRVDRARSVSLTVDGEMRVFWTPLTNPADILESAGVRVGELDRVLVDGTQTSRSELPDWPVPATHITLRRAVPISIDDAGERKTVRTTGETVGEALFDAGVTLYLADTVSPPLNEPVTAQMEVEIYRSLPVSIIADGETVQTRTQGTTVADALADAGIALVGLDTVIPSEEMRLQPGMHIRVIRVREEVITEESPLPFETVYQPDATLELDKQALVQEGREGVQQTRIRVRYENGYETERIPEETIVAQAAVNRVIAYGTNVVVRTVDTPQGPREYWRVLRLYATSYHPAALGGDNITATGRELVTGIVGADRSLLPFDTEIFVPGYGVGLIADTGPARSNPYWLDLGYSDAEYRHWARYVDVYVLTPVPEKIDYLLP